MSIGNSNYTRDDAALANACGKLAEKQLGVNLSSPNNWYEFVEEATKLGGVIDVAATELKKKYPEKPELK
jgi:hypothetical protein